MIYLIEIYGDDFSEMLVRIIILVARRLYRKSVLDCCSQI